MAIGISTVDMANRLAMSRDRKDADYWLHRDTMFYIPRGVLIHPRPVFRS